MKFADLNENRKQGKKMNLSVLFQPKVTPFNDLPGTIVL